MRNTITIAERELKSYFVSPIAYVVTALFLIVTGYFFAAILWGSQQASMRDLFSNMAVILLFIVPAITMRLLSEEQRSGTIELLLTAPVRDVEVVLGKLLSAFVLLLAMLALTLYYPLILYVIGSPDTGPLVSGYVGLILLSLVYLSVGLLASSFSQNQIVSFLVAFCAVLMLWVITYAGNFFSPSVGAVVRYLGLPEHYNDFNRGVFNLQDGVYYVSAAIVFIFAAIRSLETRRWR